MINKFLFEIVIFLNNFSIIIIQMKNYYFFIQFTFLHSQTMLIGRHFGLEKKKKKYLAHNTYSTF